MTTRGASRAGAGICAGGPSISVAADNTSIITTALQESIDWWYFVDACGSLRAGRSYWLTDGWGCDRAGTSTGSPSAGSRLFIPGLREYVYVSSTNRDITPDALDASARQFVLWMLGAFDLQVRSDQQEIYEIAVPQPVDPAAPPLAHPLAVLDRRRFCFDAQESGAAAGALPVERAAWSSPLLQSLLDELQQGRRLIQATAAHQPASVHELAEHLFAQYKVDGGHVRLAGCSLEDRPFLRLTFLQRSPAAGEPQLLHCFGTSDGELVDASLRESLDLDHLTPIAGRSPKIDRELVRRWIEVTQQLCRDEQGERQSKLIAATLVWCKHAEGKLAFTIGQQTTEVAFSGWGRMLADRRCLPPPYECPLSGRSSYHLTATDDGRITVAEAIGVCAESSRRVLKDELQTCSVTGRDVLPEYLEQCPCSGEPVLQSVLEPCSMCQQLVSPAALANGRCSACRQLRGAGRDDPNLARILDRYPSLRKLRNFKFAETATVFVLTCSSTWKRLLVVLDKQSLEPRYLATGRPFSGSWTAMGDAERDQWLGGAAT